MYDIMILIKQGIQYRFLEKGKELECLAVEIWTKKGNVNIVNFYNPR